MRLKISFGKPGLSKAHRLVPLARISQREKRKEDTATDTPTPLTFACARALISAEAFITSISYALFTHRSFPTSGESGLRFHAGTTSKYDDGSDSASTSSDDDDDDAR